LSGRDDTLDVRTGVESWFFNGKFATRLGFQMQAVTMGLGYELPVWPEPIWSSITRSRGRFEIENTVGKLTARADPSFALIDKK